MSEEKVYVEKMPESCAECPCISRDYEQGNYCNLEAFDYETCDYSEVRKSIHKNCPLQSIKDHDRELVEKVIKEVEENFTKYLPLRNRTGAWFYGRLNEILKKYQKEFEK